jgi:hypothetical protein
MRLLFLLAAAGLAVQPVCADAQRRGPPPAPDARGRGIARHGDQDAAYEAMQQGRIMSLPEIRARIVVPGAMFIGVEFDGRIYRLKYMRGSDVIWIDVDARTGRILGRMGN